MLDERAALLAKMEAKRFAIFALIETSAGPARCWTGVGPFELAPDDVDKSGGIYLGIGLVGDIPALRQLIGGTAERIDFSLSGADDLTLSLADEEADTVIGAPVNVGICFFDAKWRPSPIAWLWSGTADVPSVSEDATGPAISRSVRLSVGSAYTDRTRPFLTYWTDADHRRAHPDDSFCSRVSRYSHEQTIKWPA